MLQNITPFRRKDMKWRVEAPAVVVVSKHRFLEFWELVSSMPYGST